jgi:hypothetical protein
MPESCTADVDKGLTPDQLRVRMRVQAAIAQMKVTVMTSILTPEDVVRRIAAECIFIDELRAVGIRLRPAARSCASTASNSDDLCSEGKTASQNRRKSLTRCFI